jgi:hypothetical protein
MKLASDKLLHLKLGLAVALALVLVVCLADMVSQSAGVAVGAIACGIGYELQQKIRGDGEPSWQDALASAVPGCSIALVMFLAGK